MNESALVDDHRSASQAPSASEISDDVPGQPNDDPAEESWRRRYLVRRFLASAGGFWGRHGNATAWLLSGALALVVVLNLGTAYGMNLWNRAIFDALEKHNGSDVLFITLIYFPLLAASVGLQLALVFTRMTMQRRWRAWLNDHLVDRWLSRGRYYQLNLVEGDHKNPEFASRTTCGWQLNRRWTSSPVSCPRRSRP
jgi:putative ATP-binding cassette transporter